MAVSPLQYQFNGMALQGRQGANAPSEAHQVDRVARDLEGVFAKMMISTMREASFGDSLFPNEATHFRDMYDDQIAKALTEGEGLGLAPMIRQQLGGGTSAPDLSSVTSRGFPLDNYVRPLAAVHASAPPGGEHRAEGPLNPAASPPAFPTGPAVQPAPGSPGAAPGGAGFHPLPSRPGAGTGQTAGAAAAGGAQSAPSWRNPTVEAARGRPASAQGPEAFVAKIWPHAERAGRELGVDPKVIVAQAALETGWGRRPIGGDGNDANNLFGIKATSRWEGRAVAQSTREVYDGVETREVARFRAYDSIEQSFNDYVSLLKNSPRYADAVGMNDGRQFARALQRAGYATDPQYASKLTAIAEGPTMQRALARIDPAPTATPTRG